VSESKNHIRIHRRTIPLVFLGIVLMMAAFVAAWALYINSTQNKVADNSWYDSGMTIGSYEGATPAEIQAELDKQVAENEMNVSCAPTVSVGTTTGIAEVRVYNIAANRVDQRFTISLSDGTILYTSGAIAPDNHVQTVTLTTIPPVGSYDATITFQGYSSDTHVARGGTVSVQVKLIVS
jgi:hypothetical protein